MKKKAIRKFWYLIYVIENSAIKDRFERYDCLLSIPFDICK